MPNPFGLDPVAVLFGLNAAVLLGWGYTMYRFRRTVEAHHLAAFWWHWWVETAVRHRIELQEDDLAAAEELMPASGPSVAEQLSTVTDEWEQHVPQTEVRADD